MPSSSLPSGHIGGVAPTPSPGSGSRRLGVIGTLVWDRIRFRDGRRETAEEWGGISYALEAFSVVLPEGWEVVPLLVVGEDLGEEALHYLRTIPRVQVGPGVRVAPFPNYQVELVYQPGVRRTESLTGAVPPQGWEELRPLMEGLDACYLNFITGLELEVETALALREAFPGPLYADLHSLFLGLSMHGERVPRELPSWDRWLRSFDAVQMNEDEFELLGRSWGDPWQLAARVVGPELKLMVVTMAERGAAFVAAPEFSPDPGLWHRSRRYLAAGGAARSGRVPMEAEPEDGDPTGCGDVWGATFFGCLLAGDSLPAAMTAANALAARNARHRGARGLHLHLRGLLAG